MPSRSIFNFNMRAVLYIVTSVLLAAWAPATLAASGTPITIIFPDARSVNVSLRPEPSTPRPANPGRTLMAVFSRYHQLAIEGDAASATYVASSLTRCGNAFRTEESLTTAIYKLRSDHVLVLPDGMQIQNNGDPAQMAGQEQRVREEFEFCRGVGAKELGTLAEMREVAAAGSGFAASSRWATSLGRTEDGLAAWEYLWSEGYRQALTQLTALHASTRRDPMRAYAYLLVNVRISEAAARATRSRSEEMLANRLRGSMANWRDSLTLPQQVQAENLAFELLSKSRKCCYALPSGGL